MWDFWHGNIGDSGLDCLEVSLSDLLSKSSGKPQWRGICSDFPGSHHKWSLHIAVSLGWNNTALCILHMAPAPGVEHMDGLLVYLGVQFWKVDIFYTKKQLSYLLKTLNDHEDEGNVFSLLLELLYIWNIKPNVNQSPTLNKWVHLLVPRVNFLWCHKTTFNISSNVG